jgi:hypothetical protein
MATGNVYGDGIYMSTSFDVSKWYSFVDGNEKIQVIVNVLIPGSVKVVHPGTMLVHYFYKTF